MLHPRIIPCLLIKNKGLVKTVNFNSPKYVGDPINAVRIFNEKEVDELMVIDIDATQDGKEPNYKMIQHLAAECRMPLCYGGGVKSALQAKKIIGLGVEKVALSSAAVENPALITEIAKEIGSQSVVVVLDVKLNINTSNYEVWTHNGTKRTNLCPAGLAKKLEILGAGEIVLNSIDQDGMMKGYDLELAEKVRTSISLPMTMLGGAGTLKDIGSLINRFGIIGAAAGSLFVFKGIYKAVLINYPDKTTKKSLIENNFIK